MLAFKLSLSALVVTPFHTFDESKIFIDSRRVRNKVFKLHYHVHDLFGVVNVVYDLTAQSRDHRFKQNRTFHSQKYDFTNKRPTKLEFIDKC